VVHVIIKTARTRTRAEAPSTTTPTVLWAATLPGDWVGSARSRRAALVRGLPQVVLSDEAVRWQRRALRMVAARRPTRPFGVALAAECRAWGADPAARLDAPLCLELLERGAVIASAGQIRQIGLVHSIDTDVPRIELRLLACDGEAR
jgi:hypothetical protein